MNFVVGFILIMSGGKEEESFWFLVGLLQVHMDIEPFFAGFEGLYQTKFPLLHTFLGFFDSSFHKEFPELAKHFTKQGMPPLLWCAKWFQTFFLYSFSFSACIRFWDCLFAHGTDTIFRITFAILKLCEKDLLQLDIEGINDYFNNF